MEHNVLKGACKGNLTWQLMKAGLRTSPACTNGEKIAFREDTFCKVLLIVVAVKGGIEKGAFYPQMKVTVEFQFLALKISPDHSKPM